MKGRKCVKLQPLKVSRQHRLKRLRNFDIICQHIFKFPLYKYFLKIANKLEFFYEQFNVTDVLLDYHRTTLPLTHLDRPREFYLPKEILPGAQA